MKDVLADGEEAVRLNPLDKDAFYLMSEAKLLGGKYAEAKQTAQAALDAQQQTIEMGGDFCECDFDYDPNDLKRGVRSPEHVIYYAELSQQIVKAWEQPRIIRENRAKVFKKKPPPKVRSSVMPALVALPSAPPEAPKMESIDKVQQRVRRASVRGLQALADAEDGEYCTPSLE